MLEYKCVLAGKTLEYIDERDSSKRCSRCGHLQPMPHNPRTYRCQNCGLVLDRDENSAVNHAPAVLCPAPVHTRVIPCGVRLYAPQLTTRRKADASSGVFYPLDLKHT